MNRDILIFPKFDNVEIIQQIRKENDRLFNLIAPHITIVFPFKDEIKNEILIKKIKTVLKNFKKFKVVFRGISLSDDNYIYLNCIEGYEQLVKLHDEIYNNILPFHLKKDIKYIPHITLGQSDNINFLNDFNVSFETIIDEICVEEIGIKEESIIVETIKLD